MWRRLADRFTRGVARLMARAFFRRVEVVGLGRIPRGRPLILVGNHVNSLIDPLMFVAFLPVLPRFLAKSTLFLKPHLRPILALAGAVPVYRRQDEGVDTAKNLETFARCHELLAAGGAIGIFPEGISHSEPALAPLKTGAARITLEAEERFPGLGVAIVPVGLMWDEKERFRSRALVEVGEPIDPSPEVASAAEDEPAAVRALTARIEAGLKAVTLNYGSWEEAALIGRAADLFGRPALALPTDRTLAEDFSLHQRFIEGFAELRERFPARTGKAAEAVAAYDRLLETAGFTDEQVAARYPLPTVLRSLVRLLIKLLFGLPLALAGTVLNWVPYRLAGFIGRKVGTEPDIVSTYKLFPSLVLFPLTWAVTAGLAGWWWGPWAALAGLFAAPLCGWVALRFHDRRASLQRGVRAYWLLATRHRLAEELRRRRKLAYDEITALAELARTGTSEHRENDPTPLS